MQTLFEFSYADQQIELVSDGLSEVEVVLVDGLEVSRVTSSASFSSEHAFRLPSVGLVNLKTQIARDKGSVSYRLEHQEVVLHRAVVAMSLHPELVPAMTPPLEEVATETPKRSSWIPLVGAIFKLSKSAGAIKVALAGASFASWSLLTDWRFAAILIAIIVFHEYGHVRAMRACGIPTKGLYLIPFFGGVAIGERARSYWHEVYVSMMGPVFGLLMTVVALIGYWVLDSHLLGLVASYSALINLFNLLPIYPLDGGHVLKAVAVSASPKRSVIGLLLFSAAGFAAALHFNLHLLSFFLVLGVVDLLLTRKSLVNSEVTPMGGYAMLVSTVWYVAVVAIFVGIILYLVEQAVPGSEIPKLILTD